MATTTTTTAKHSNYNRRNKVNLLSFLTSLIFFLVSVAVVEMTSSAARLNHIKENLDESLSKAMTAKSVNFTQIQTGDSYVVKLEFHPNGMDHLYNWTTEFMDLVFTKNINPNRFVYVDNRQIRFGSIQDHWKSLLDNYWSVLVLFIVLMIVIGLLPLFGLGFCCCRYCCGRCGAKSQPCDKKHDCCKKFCLAAILLALWTLLLFCVVCVFASNHQLEHGVDTVVPKLRRSVNDTNQYVDRTNEQMRILLKVNYQEFQSVLFATISDGMNIVYDQLASYSNASHITALREIVEKLPKIQRDFTTIKEGTDNLVALADTLYYEINSKKASLSIVLSNCSITKCNEMKNRLKILNTNIDYNKLPNLTKPIVQLDALVKNGGFVEAVNHGLQALDNVKRKIGDNVNRTLDDAKHHIRVVHDDIHRHYLNATGATNDVRERFNKVAGPHLERTDRWLNQYGPYRYYWCLGLSCALLIICTLIALGMVCGVCGKRPDMYGDDNCCNKAAGSQFLVCAALLMLFVGGAMAATVFVGLTVGASVQRVVCDQLEVAPADSQLLEIVDSAFIADDQRSIRDVLRQCRRNVSIYQALDLRQEFDLDDIAVKANILDIVNKLNVSSDVFTKDFHILNETDSSTLMSLAYDEFAVVDFTKYVQTLETNFTTVDLRLISDELSQIVAQLYSIDNASNAAREFAGIRDSIDAVYANTVLPMKRNASQIIKLANQLNNDLLHGDDFFLKTIDGILNDLKSSEELLKREGTARLQSITRAFAQGLTQQVNVYVERIVHLIKEDVGRCGTITRILNNTVTATCDSILIPWNGYWFSLMVTVILFIPTIIVSIKLSKLYQNFRPYRDSLYEGDYLYDAYADRDSVPLNSRHSKDKKYKGRRKYKKYRGYEERRQSAVTPTSDMGAMPVGAPPTAMPPSRDHAPNNNSGGNPREHETRYTDMAPKHWDEYPPAGHGPPHYQRAPTEYERPPPYYYPPNDENQ